MRTYDELKNMSPKELWAEYLIARDSYVNSTSIKTSQYFSRISTIIRNRGIEFLSELVK